MKVKNFIYELIKFYFKYGNCGIVRWKQHTGYVFVYEDFLILDPTTIQVRNGLYSPTYCFNEHVRCHILKYIFNLIKMYINFGNVDIVMWWDEDSGSLPRNGFLPISKVNLINRDGHNYCEIS